MPPWLLQIAELILDRSDDAFRKAWSQRLCEALARLDNPVPFRLIHDWHANTVSPLVIESCWERGLSMHEHEELREMHRRAWRADDGSEEAWRRALEPALHAVYFHSYPYQEAFAVAADAGSTYALLHGSSAVEAKKYGEQYAELNTGANARLFSAANAKANSAAYAKAFVRSDHDLLARAYPGAYVQACASLASTEHIGGPAGYARLGDGLIDSLGGCGGRA